MGGLTADADRRNVRCGRHQRESDATATLRDVTTQTRK
jgi:hypothetical protein